MSIAPLAKAVAHNQHSHSVTPNPWSALRQFTLARIALGRAGVSLPTQPQLAFQLAHAQARDAVHLPLNAVQLAQDLESLGVCPARSCLQLESAAGDRTTYLQRPDLGRRLGEASRALLSARAAQSPAAPFDIAFVIADGLSAQAVAQHAAPFLRIVMPCIAQEGWTLAPVSIVKLGRVALADEVAQCLGARLVVLLIGERPGLSSPDSMGLYITWAPRVGLSDAERNCISNVRPAGLSFDDAAVKLHYLLSEMQRRQLSGVQLKDESGGAETTLASGSNFLLNG